SGQQLVRHHLSGRRSSRVDCPACAGAGRPLPDGPLRMTRASGTHATEPIEVLSAFTLPGPVRDCTRLAGGHINASWRVRPEGSEGPPYPPARPDPDLLRAG